MNYSKTETFTLIKMLTKSVLKKKKKSKMNNCINFKF